MKPHRLRELGVLGLFVLVALWTRRHWLSADLPALVQGVMPDDAFYYFEIARRVWSDGGVTFDGTTPATGFHPLWLVLVLPFFRHVAPGAETPVWETLLLATVLSAAAAFQLARLAQRLTGRLGLALALGLAFGGNLWVVRESLNGLETILSLALLVTLLSSVAGYLETPNVARALGVGIVAALSILARSDMALVAGPLCLLCVIAGRGLGWSLAAVAGPPLLAVLGLTGFNLWLTGQPLQSSALATPLLVRMNWHRLHHFSATAHQAHEYGLEVLRESVALSREALGPVAAGALVASLMIALGALAALRGRLARPTLHGALAVLALVLGLLALHVVHGYLRWFPRSWYFPAWGLAAYASVAAAAACLLNVTELWQARGSQRVVAWGLTASVLVAFALETGRTARELPEPRYRWQLEMFEAGRGIRTLVPEGEPVGSFNAAIIGYVSGGTVVNLDGVVNEAAAAGLRQAALGRYMQGRGIRYLLDYPVMWSHHVFRYAAGPLMGPEFASARRVVVWRFDVPGTGWPSPDAAIELLYIDWKPEPAPPAPPR